MGIPGLYNQIGNGERIAFAKLAQDHFQTYGRKLRVAIDASIWLFQIKSGRGGSNPQIRTLYYRLLKLLRLGVEPVFVFDGPSRPAEKRNKKVTGSWESPQARQSRELLDVFGLIHHLAPGEAEAECALLQKRGIVDAVFSEDVDTLMFGATFTLRNWSSEGDRTRSHLNAFHAKDIKAKSRLDREGMVLVALMSGADYDTAGLERCGPRVAYEAAKAGFGHDLCKLNSTDTVGLAEWRERLQYELHCNESGFFRTKHPRIKIPETFPNQAILQDYMNPLVSPDSELDVLRSRIDAPRTLDVFALRIFVKETFAWDTLAGAKKYIRGLAPALLTYQLLQKRPRGPGPEGLTSVCGSRTHHTTGGILESRVEIKPIELVPLDLESELLKRPESEDLPSLELSESEVSDVDMVALETQRGRDSPSSPKKKRGPSRYDPTEPEKFYVSEFYVRFGAPEKVEAWEASLEASRLASPKKSRTKQAQGKPGLRDGSIHDFFGVKKPNAVPPSTPTRAPPAKKARPVAPVRLKTDSDIPVSSYTSQLLTALQPVSDTSQSCLDVRSRSTLETQGKPSWKSPARLGPLSPDRGEKALPCISSSTGSDKKTDIDTDSSPSSSSRGNRQMMSEQIPAAFSSPISSQDLLDISKEPVMPQSTAPRLPSNVRVRDSLEGAWAHTSPQNRRGGTKLADVETVDLT